MNTLAILAYHKIGDPPPDGWHTWNYVTAEAFENQLRYLKENSWDVINSDQFLEILRDPATVTSKAVLITFDDGYRSNLRVALPILKKFSYPAIIFVPTKFVGKYNSFDADIFYEPKEFICTWEELRELERNNISVQSHGSTHQHFSKLSAAERLSEVNKSKYLIEKNLNKKVDYFSFPYGDEGEDHKETKGILEGAGYKAAFLYGGPPIRFPIKSKFRLTRVPIGADTDLEEVLADPINDPGTGLNPNF